ncbi:hypothetical protein N7527_004342 [Penicillium freii]|nr:hypothetical protein N7527_004342 [Penicillium freii]
MANALSSTQMAEYTGKIEYEAKLPDESTSPKEPKHSEDELSSLTNQTREELRPTAPTYPYAKIAKTSITSSVTDQVRKLHAPSLC